MADDAINASSLALSALALIAVFETCLKGCEVVSSARTTGKSCHGLLAQIDVEKRRLAIWGRRWGLRSENINNLEHELNIADTRQIIHDCLTSIELAVCDIEELQNKYGLELSDLTPEGVADTLPTTFGGTNAKHPSLTRSKEVWQKRIEARNKERTFLRNISYSFNDEAKLSNLLKTVTWFVDRLWGLLVTEKLLGIEQCLATEVLSSATSQDRLQTLHASSERRPNDIQRHVGNQLFAQAIESTDRSDPNRYNFERKYSKDVMRIKSSCREAFVHTVGEFVEKIQSASRGHQWRPVPVFFEWKRGNWDAEMTNGMEKRIDNLTIMLSRCKSSIESENYRVLECIGWFDDQRPRTYEILYRLPKPANSIEEPVSLYDLLAADNCDLDRMPSLNTRIHLAKLLTTSLHELHSSGWLHKQISSHNVIFFKREGRTSLTMKDLLEPYFVGFGVSRPSNDPRGTESKTPPSERATVDLYRHPSQLVSSSRREHDIYSLGLLLLEIARWNRLETLIEDKQESPEGFHDRVALYAEEIDFDVGETYCEVVQTMIKGVDGSNWTSPISLFSSELTSSSPTENENQGKVLRNFYYCAVAKLEKICV